MELVITIINSILAKALNHRQFKEFLFEMESECADLLLHNKVRWFSRGNVLKRFAEDERGLMPTSAIKDILKRWKAVRAMVLEWHPNQADVRRIGDLYNDNTINYFRKIPEKERKVIVTLDMFFNAL
ncbi:uncharacterized protein TNCV_1968901 [Trichonephila clavipes]|nr:uncharacterized protein TNCV_1968901 [Trichonephila clavipes]